MQHWNADTSVPGAKGRTVNIWAKLDTTGDSAGRRHNIAGVSNSKWDVLSIENMKDLQSSLPQSRPPQRGEKGIHL